VSCLLIVTLHHVDVRLTCLINITYLLTYISVFKLGLYRNKSLHLSRKSSHPRNVYCATQICIARTSYGDVAGWVAVRHRPVLYQNG